MKSSKTLKKSDQIKRIVLFYGEDILLSPTMQEEKSFMQHGKVSVFEHSLAVACFAVRMCVFLKIRVDKESLIRGALLHDYFLYDWHVSDPSHRLHGFSHAKTAFKNASRDFEISIIEKDIIEKHMFPLNIKPPLYRESIIVCISDKICALRETLGFTYD